MRLDKSLKSMTVELWAANVMAQPMEISKSRAPFL